ncbi:DUF1330 domain-containing protein [Phenylobacterium aquaticum]|uniref:DUF1330 domain-containing protein n=1 Tax=Phenylobacterium aquaticum TaxID=1763816 RepID=UPI0026EE81E3|nr:DUF1330 domain-containing protein [Phenylobacterium aquaticum]
MKVENAVIPGMAQVQAFFGAPEDGPYVMVNLLKFRDKAAYEDGSEPELSGRAAYARYGEGVSKLVAELGGRMLFSGDVTSLMIGEVEELWDMVALVEYPSLEAFRTMAMSPGMHAIEHHRKAGLAGQLNIRTKMRA